MHGAKITDEVREELLAKDPKKQRMSMLQRRSQMKSLHSRRGNMSMNSQVCYIYVSTYVHLYAYVYVHVYLYVPYMDMYACM